MEDRFFFFCLFFINLLQKVTAEEPKISDSLCLSGSGWFQKSCQTQIRKVLPSPGSSVCLKSREGDSICHTLVWLFSISQLIYSCHFCCYPVTRPCLSGAAFELHCGHTMLTLMLSLSQQQIKTSVGGCGTVWAWPDSVTWNTGSEHKQGHCSLKKKLGRSKVDLLPWLGTGTRNPIIVRSV